MAGDGRWPTYEPGEEPGAPGEPREPREPSRREQPVAPAKREIAVTPAPPSGQVRHATLIRVLLLGVLPVVLIATIGLLAYLGSDRDGLGFGGPDAQSAEGLEQLLDDLEERSGGTEVFRAVIYPDYAVVDVPVDATSQREESLYWNGSFDDFGGKGTSTETRVDLAELDADLMTETLDEVKGLVEDPETWHVSLGADDEEGPTLSAYASNEFSETAWINVRFDGTEVRRSAPDVP